MFKIYLSIFIATFLLIGTAYASSPRLRVPLASSAASSSASTAARSTGSAASSARAATTNSSRRPLATAGGVSLYGPQPHPTGLQSTASPMDISSASTTTHSAGASASGAAPSSQTGATAPHRRRSRLKHTTTSKERAAGQRQHITQQQRAERARLTQARRQQAEERQAVKTELAQVKTSTLGELENIRLTQRHRNKWFPGIEEGPAKERMALVLIARREGVSPNLIRDGLGTVKNQAEGLAEASLTPQKYKNMLKLYTQQGIKVDVIRNPTRNIFDRRLFVAAIKKGKTPEEALEHVIQGRLLGKRNMKQQDVPSTLKLRNEMPSLEDILLKYQFSEGITESVLAKHSNEIFEVLGMTSQRQPVPQTAVLAALAEQYPLAGRARGEAIMSGEQLSRWLTKQRPDRQRYIGERANPSKKLVETIKREHWNMERLVRYHGGEGRRFAPTKTAAISAPELRDTLSELVAVNKVDGKWVNLSLERADIIEDTFTEVVKQTLRDQGIRSGNKGIAHLQNAAIATWFENGVGAKGPNELLEFVRGLGSINHYQKILALTNNPLTAQLPTSMQTGLKHYGLTAEVVSLYATRDSRQQIPQQAVAHWWREHHKTPGVHKFVSRPNNKLARELFENPGRPQQWTLAELVGPATPLTRK